MKVFISWSTPRSHEVGKLLAEWLEDLIQALKPWISSKDIDSGARWNSVINDELEKTSVGIICLTQENKNNPWILFEAGALAKQAESSIIGTFLIDLKDQDLTAPLSQFNHTTPEKESMLKLFKTINKALGEDGRTEIKLEKAFNDRWESNIAKFETILENTPANKKIEERTDKNILLEILSTTRSLERNLEKGNLESDEIKKKDLYISILKNLVANKGNEKLVLDDLDKAVEPYGNLMIKNFNVQAIFGQLIAKGFSDAQIEYAEAYFDRISKNQSNINE